MDGVGLIHMNGRVYDANLGRFLSADPFIQDRTNLQALNRYSYVENNPLSYTDPSGYFLKKAFKKLGKAVKKAWKGIRTGVQSIFQGIGQVINAVPYLSTVVGVALSVINPAAGAIYFKVLAGLNAAVSLANGASIGDAATSFTVGMVASGLGSGIGDMLSDAGAGAVGSYIGSGITGGAATKAMGGSFEDGFKAGLAGRLIGAATKSIAEALKPEPELLLASASGFGAPPVPGQGGAEILVHEPTGWGRSSFGHVATRIGNTVYSFGPNGMDILDADEYMAKNDFRSAVGTVLNLSEAETRSFENYLANYDSDYNSFYRNCGSPVASGLTSIGRGIGGVNVLPVSLGNALLNSGMVSRTRFYPQTGARISPWYYPTESKPWVR